MYKATIYFEAIEDSYAEGELDSVGNSWIDELTADTTEELKALVLEATYSEWEDVDGEQINEYEDRSEYHVTYLADADNYESTKAQIEAWKKGELRLWAINCHILVCEVIEKKAVL